MQKETNICLSKKYFILETEEGKKQTILKKATKKLKLKHGNQYGRISILEMVNSLQ